MDNTVPGLAHFVGQTDTVGKILLVILALMSILSWSLIVSKSVSYIMARQSSERFLKAFWNASSLAAVAAEIARRGASDPVSRLTAQALEARAHYDRHGATRLADAGSAGDFIARTMKGVIDEQTTALESGLAALASVGATAPFVGLFGTVWGVYHALVAIGMSGAGTLDKVAGPVGEALIMTAVGLAVAIPAVLGYNFFVRRNRLTLSRLDSFAHQLFTFLTTGQTLQSGEGAGGAGQSAGQSGSQSAGQGSARPVDTSRPAAA